MTRLLTFCFRNLFRRKVRTFLCVLGVAIAVTFVTAVGATTMRYTAVIREMDVLFSGQVMVVSKNAIVVQAVPIGGSTLPQGSTTDEISKIPGVGAVTPVLFVTSLGSQALVGTVPANFTIGIPLHDWTLVLGPIPLKEGGRLPMNDSSNEIVVGPSLADQYHLAVNTEIELNGYTLRISGIFNTKMALLNQCFVMPLTLAQEVYNYPKSVNIIAVKPLENTSEQNLTVAIKQRIDYVNALTETQRNDVIEPVLEQMQTWTTGIETVIFILSLVLVTTVNIMSVSERRRDFATLDAIGAPASYMLKMVMVESVLIGVLGGIIGIAFGSLEAIVLASAFTNIPIVLFFPSILELVPPLFMTEMFAATLAVCCLGGVIPAVNAMRMRVAEVLRAEY